ncbi:MAG: hypothetical protein FJ265_18660 [Planctomycetes bacterium]|nr:hypothetical protein [Planctomycetota bacterium]
MNKQKRKGLGPVVVVPLLIACGGFAAWQLSGRGLLADGPGAGSAARSDAAEMPGEDGQGGDGKSAEAQRWGDLLAAHGSFARQGEVPLVFTVLADAAATGAAPAAETQAGAAARWSGEDPPALQLGVLLISGAARRAVLGGRIVGVGDAVAGGRVASIERGAVVLRWGGRSLTYDMDDPYPREFRAERQRRAAEQAGHELQAGQAKTDESGRQDPAPVAESKANQEARK